MYLRMSASIYTNKSRSPDYAWPGFSKEIFPAKPKFTLLSITVKPCMGWKKRLQHCVFFTFPHPKPTLRKPSPLRIEQGLFRPTLQGRNAKHLLSVKGGSSRTAERGEERHLRSIRFEKIPRLAAQEDGIVAGRTENYRGYT